MTTPLPPAALLLLAALTGAAAAQSGDYYDRPYAFGPQPPRVIIIWPGDPDRPRNAYQAWRYDQARRLQWESAVAAQKLAIREARAALGKLAREERDLREQDRQDRIIAKRVKIAERKARRNLH